MSKAIPVIVLVGLLLAYAVTQFVPSVNPFAPQGPDMVAAFTENANRTGVEAKKDAVQFAALCHALHDCLKSDWEQDSFIKTATQIDNLRIIARKIRTNNKPYSQHYPALPKVIEKHFNDSVGRDGGPLSDEAKDNWLKAFKELAECSDYAASRL